MTTRRWIEQCGWGTVSLPTIWLAWWWRAWPNATSRCGRSTMDHAAGNPTPLKCCWACCSLSLPLGYSGHARWSVLPMRLYLFAPLQAMCLPITRRWQRFGVHFFPNGTICPRDAQGASLRKRMGGRIRPEKGRAGAKKERCFDEEEPSSSR